MMRVRYKKDVQKEADGKSGVRNIESSISIFTCGPLGCVAEV